MYKLSNSPQLSQKTLSLTGRILSVSLVRCSLKFYLASRISFQESLSLLTCMNVKRSQVTSSHWLTPHCCMYLNMACHLPSTKIHFKDVWHNPNGINLKLSK